MCIYPYPDKSLWVHWHHNIHFLLMHGKIGQTYNADPKKYNLIRNDICHKQTPKWKGYVDFTACLLIFWIQHTWKPLYTKFGAFHRKWRSLPLFVTYLRHYFDNFDQNRKFSKILTKIEIFDIFDQIEIFENFYQNLIFFQIWPNSRSSNIYYEIIIFRKFWQKSKFVENFGHYRDCR